MPYHSQSDVYYKHYIHLQKSLSPIYTSDKSPYYGPDSDLSYTDVNLKLVELLWLYSDVTEIQIHHVNIVYTFSQSIFISINNVLP